jgi:DHA2 family multidrug resistance protein
MKSSPTSLLIALFCTLFSTIFNYTLSIMASPYIAGELGGSNDITTYTVSLFALGNALSIPLGRPLLLRIGAMRLIVTATLLFAFFSWTCAVAPTYPFFNASRFLQGFVSGPFYALVFYLFSVFVPKENKGIITSIALMIFTIGPVVGASWGGWIAYEWEWRYVFYLNIPIELFLAWFLFRKLRDLKEEKPSLPPFDTVGYLTYFISLFCLGFSLITGQELDWFRSPFITALVAIAIPTLLFFILWELNHPDPILHLNLLKSFTLSFALFNLAILFSAYFGMVILLALWLNLWANYTPDWIGVLLGTMAIAGLFPMFLIDRRIARIDNRIFLSAAVLLLALSCYHTMLFNVEINFGRIAYSRILAGFGLALFLAPIFRLCFHSYPEENRLHILGLFQVVRALASGLGCSIYATIWQRRQVFYHDRLGGELTPFSHNTAAFFTTAKEVQLTGDHAYSKLNFYLDREASSLALDDCFYLMAWILIGLLLTFLFTFLCKQEKFVTVESEITP